MTETELIRGYLAGQNNDCLSQLYRRYYPRVLAKCVTMVKDADAAQDHAQEIFLKAFSNLPRFAHRAQFGTWLHSITYHYCLDQLKRQKESALLELTPELLERQVDAGGEPEELSQWAEQALGLLPASSVRLLEQKYLLGLSLEEMAVYNQTSASAIKMRLLRARQAVRAATQTLARGGD